MRKIVLTLLSVALAGLILSNVTEAAMTSERDDSHLENVYTGRSFQPWAEGHAFTEYVPHPFYYPPYQPHPPVRVVPLPRDIRVLIAEREMLKVDFHYYSLSPYPGNQARAAATAGRLREVEHMIEAWRFAYR